MELKNLKKKKFCFIYISRDDCNVCHAILPKIERLIKDYSKAEFFRIKLEDYPQAAGEFSVFSIPALLVYSEEKEIYRGARFFNMQELKKLLDKNYSFIFESTI